LPVFTVQGPLEKMLLSELHWKLAMTGAAPPPGGGGAVVTVSMAPHVCVSVLPLFGLVAVIVSTEPPAGVEAVVIIETAWAPELGGGVVVVEPTVVELLGLPDTLNVIGVVRLLLTVYGTVHEAVAPWATD